MQYGQEEKRDIEIIDDKTTREISAPIIEGSLRSRILHVQNNDHNQYMRKLHHIELKIRNNRFILNRGGVTMVGQVGKYVTARSKQICDIIKDAKSKAVFTEESYIGFKQRILHILENNLNNNKGISLGLFSVRKRDETTAQLYRDIVISLGYKLITDKDAGNCTYKLSDPHESPRLG